MMECLCVAMRECKVYICMNVFICVHIYMYMSMLVVCKNILLVSIYDCMYMSGNASMLTCKHENVHAYMYVHM